VIEIKPGDVREVLKDYPDESFVAAFTDPPYGLGKQPNMQEVLTHWLAGDDYEADGGGFMGKSWDGFVPGPATWREVYRVLKPGAVLLAFGGTRTVDMLSVSLRLAGFHKFDEIDYFYGGLPPQINWITGSGFPKGHDISKAIDKAAGATREVVGTYRVSGNALTSTKDKGGTYGVGVPNSPPGNIDITAPATPDAVTWQGYNVSLKPAHEIILCFRKPRTGTYAQMAVEHGTAALWIDGCRIATTDVVRSSHNVTIGGKGIYGGGVAATTGALPGQGRWPANLLLDEEAAAMLDAQAGKQVSRFFYCSKASKRERDAGLEGMEKRPAQCTHWSGDGMPLRQDGTERKMPIRVNHHPTVKPLALCEYLARLIVPPETYRDEAKLLVPFAGVASEMIGAWQAGWRNIVGIELEEEYCEIARVRLEHWRRERWCIRY